MPHTTEVMYRLKNIVEREWPDCKAQFDSRLPGTTRRPDAIVTKNDCIKCVIEIGYTDAAKLAIYRKLGVPEIRWYDKEFNLVLRESKESLAKKLSREFRALRSVKAPRRSQVERDAAELLEARMYPPVDFLGIGTKEEIDQIFPGPFGWYATDAECVLCEGKPLECEYQEERCVSTDYVVFDPRLVAIYEDCQCRDDHSGLFMEPFAHDEWGVSYPAHCRAFMRRVVRDFAQYKNSNSNEDTDVSIPSPS